MKHRAPTARAIGFVVAAAIAVFASVDAHATAYYWDTNGASPGIGSAVGAAADWLTDSWATGSSGTLTTGAWPNSQPDNADEAVFMGTSGTVNLDADVYANALSFETNGYQIASTGGALYLDGANPTIDVSLPDNNNTATISAPILGDNGFTLTGNSLPDGLKFLVLANADAANPNAFSGTLTIEAGGALRLGGGVANEQIPDDVDMAVSGVIDFVTSGGASDGKQERIRNVTVTGGNSIFSVGNGSDFIVNSMSGSGTDSISVNGNAASVPGRLIINGWSDGAGNLTLNNSSARINTTSSSAGIGGRILLSGNLNSSGVSQVVNNHGGTSPDDHNFPNRAFDFTGTAHTINVSSGILTFTSRSAIFPLDVTSSNPGGTTVTKTGPGVWLYEHAAQSSFTGTNRIEEGTLRLGASERLANASQLEVAGGTFDLRGFTERVATVVLESGEITGTAGAMLSGTLFEVLDGVIDVRLSGTARLAKSTAGTVVLNGMNGYTQATTISGGALLVNGNHSGGATYLVHQAGTLGGSGSIDAPVSVEGTLAPGASVGTFTVNNAVTFDVGAHFAVELSGATADKLVAVDLNLDADEFLDVSVLSDLIGSSWVVAEYTGALSGQFDQVTPGFRADYSTPGQIVLKVAVSGDYNSNGVVDAADYTVWRDALGSNVAPGSGADGTGPSGTPDGMVDQLDYQFWKDHFGDSGSGSGALAGTFAVPEPATTSLAGLMAGYLVIAGRNFTIQNLK